MSGAISGDKIHPDSANTILDDAHVYYEKIGEPLKIIVVNAGDPTNPPLLPANDGKMATYPLSLSETLLIHNNVSSVVSESENAHTADLKNSLIGTGSAAPVVRETV